MLRKGRLKYKILPGILETRSWAQLSPGLPLQESQHQTLDVSRSILGCRNVCTTPGTKARMPWRNSHRLLWDLVRTSPVTMQGLVPFCSQKSLGCVWTDTPGMHQGEGRVPSMCSQSSPSIHTCSRAIQEDGWAGPHLWKGIHVFWCCLSTGSWLFCIRCWCISESAWHSGAVKSGINPAHGGTMLQTNSLYQQIQFYCYSFFT